MERIKIVRYILFVSSLLVTFNNLIDCINKGSSIERYLFYVATMGIVTLLLLFVKNNIIIVIVLTFVGSLSIMDIPEPNHLTAGVMFLLFAARIVNNKIYSVLTFIFILISVIVTHVLNSISPADMMNVVIAYGVLFSLDLLILKVGENG